MRMAALAFALVLSVCGSATAQEWDLYTNIPDGFKVNFPGQPTVTTTTWKSQLGTTRFRRVCIAPAGAQSVTQ